MESKVNLSDFTPEQLKAIEMLATPGEKMTDVKMCEELGIHVMTLWRWKQKPEFTQAVNDLAYSFLKSELPEVYKALATQAKSGNTKAIEILLRFADNYIERTETKLTDTVITISLDNDDEEDIEEDNNEEEIDNYFKQ